MKRRTKIILVAILAIFFVFGTKYGNLNSLLKNHPVTANTTITGCKTVIEPITPTPIAPEPEMILGLPSDYLASEEQPDLCAKRLGIEYLHDFRPETYCSELESESQLTCFHSQTDKSGRIDSFCIGQRAELVKLEKRFQLSCHPNGEKANKSSVHIPLSAIPKSWYDTGPRILLEDFVDLVGDRVTDLPVKNEPLTKNTFSVLVKREGAINPWHSLMEIMSLSMTFDVLQIKSNARRGAFITPEDASNTQVIILDDAVDGPYFDLWRLFAKKPTIRLSSLPEKLDTTNIILPLPGASNPIWQGDWMPDICTHSELIRTFAKRVLKHYNISASETKDHNKIIVTFIDRRRSRKLVDMEKHITTLND